ncbi:hypothetical protein JTE90_029397 [Oedothorax gibbosus]|uniref:Uncharacterized protein n=1 Tax=Oedothorax gibbosus TaxID=931172 RepID=A0AAV6UAI4_9ARAC|nr:hypothetical protein JTE90_029397 [Oedothorax gibbosus]
MIVSAPIQTQNTQSERLHQTINPDTIPFTRFQNKDSKAPQNQNWKLRTFIPNGTTLTLSTLYKSTFKYQQHSLKNDGRKHRDHWWCSPWSLLLSQEGLLQGSLDEGKINEG